MSNKNDTPDSSRRRDFLAKTLALIPTVAIGSSLGGLTSSSVAQAASLPAEAASETDNQQARDYFPTFFSSEEFAFIQAAVAVLIPNDQYGPGALEAGVPEFIDRQMNTPYGSGSNWYMQGPFNPDAAPELGYQRPLVPRDIYKLGIAEADKVARQQMGKGFSQLSVSKQSQLLSKMESDQVNFEQLPASLFFATLLQNTREGFFSDPIHGGNQNMVGWNLIGFPGARADFMDWVERDEAYPFPPVSITGQRG